MSDEYEGEADVEVTRTKTTSTIRGSVLTDHPKSSQKTSQNFIPKQQQLFLIEFLIDTVTIDPSGLDEEVMEGQTCLTLKFLHFPPMDICEKDFDPQKEVGMEKVRFNSGKSLMFAFSEAQCENPPPLSVEVTVNKKSPEGSRANKVAVGSIRVCLAELFRQTYEVAKYKPDRLPTSKSIKDCFMLVGPGKRTMGEVGVYIRLSCLGQNVVTEFQCGMDMKEDPILFKNREGRKVFQFMGNEMNPEDAEGSQPFREGCGCLGPAPQRNRGGQGDAERHFPSKRGGANAFAQGNRVVVDIPDKSARGGRNVDRCKMSNRNDNVTDKDRTKEGLTVSQVNANPDQNCFVLRVGDKGQIPDRGKMLLEFRTPKQKILQKVLPPYHEDVAVQTESPKKGKGGKKKK